jgi:hypothetical protein
LLDGDIGAHAHLVKVAARGDEEADARLAGDGSRQEGLAGTGRTGEEDAAGELAAELAELGRILEEFNDLLQLGLGFFAAVSKGRPSATMALTGGTHTTHTSAKVTG